MRFAKWLFLIGTLLLLTAAPTLALGNVPAYEPTECWFDIPNGVDVECGWLTVPAVRSDPNSGTIRLAVGVFHSNNANPAADPIVYLEGGPGGNPLEVVPLVFNQRFAPFLDYSDFIIFDQRGTGYSEPALDCAETTELGFELLDQDIEPQEALELNNDALTACYNRLVDEGVNFAAFNSAESAADVYDLMRTLGYTEWNLYGISYGTRLAQTIMRDYPTGVRSVILDSSYPIDADLYETAPVNADRAFTTFFEGCAADAACNAAYPNLSDVFDTAIATLNAEPQLIQITNPFTNETYDVLVDGDSMIGLLFQLLYDTTIIPALPQIIYQVADGNLDTVALIYGSLIAQVDFSSPGMQLAVQCNEEVSFSDAQRVADAAQAFPRLQPFFEFSNLGPNIFTVCAFWDSGHAQAIENEPIFSDIPTLVLAGEYDPITPPSWGQQVSANLSNSYFFEFPGTGHGASVSGNDCPLNITLDFLRSPGAEPDSSCIAEMGAPTFVVPSGDGGEIALVSHSSETFGYTVLVPDGWDESAPGVFLRQESSVDQAGIVIQAAPVDADTLVSGLATQFGLPDVPEPVDTATYGSFEWTLYEFTLQGLPVDLAVTNVDGTTYLVLLISSPGERDSLLEQVFYPALESMTIGE